MPSDIQKSERTAWAEASELIRSPLFVVGAERSGTTWLQRLLLEDHRFAGGQETHFFSFAPAPARLLHLDSQERKVGPRCYGLNEDDFINIARGLWGRFATPVAERFPKAVVLVEKTPSHAFHLSDIFMVFDNPRVLHIVRDGRATSLSLLRANRDDWGKGWAPSKFRHACQSWARAVTHAEAGATSNPESCLRVHYEKLRSDVQGAMDCIVRFALGRDDARWEPGSASASAFGFEHSEPNGFAREAPADAWRTEISYFQRLIAAVLIGDKLREYGYPRF